MGPVKMKAKFPMKMSPRSESDQGSASSMVPSDEPSSAKLYDSPFGPSRFPIKKTIPGGKAKGPPPSYAGGAKPSFPMKKTAGKKSPFPSKSIKDVFGSDHPFKAKSKFAERSLPSKSTSIKSNLSSSTSDEEEGGFPPERSDSITKPLGASARMTLSTSSSKEDDLQTELVKDVESEIVDVEVVPSRSVSKEIEEKTRVFSVDNLERSETSEQEEFDADEAPKESATNLFSKSDTIQSMRSEEPCEDIQSSPQSKIDLSKPSIDEEDQSEVSDDLNNDLSKASASKERSKSKSGSKHLLRSSSSTISAKPIIDPVVMPLSYMLSSKSASKISNSGSGSTERLYSTVVKTSTSYFEPAIYDLSPILLDVEDSGSGAKISDNVEFFSSSATSVDESPSLEAVKASEAIRLSEGGEEVGDSEASVCIVSNTSKSYDSISEEIDTDEKPKKQIKTEDG